MNVPKNQTGERDEGPGGGAAPSGGSVPGAKNSNPAWVTDANAALLTDLYELTMLQAYRDAGVTGTAVFDLFARRLPERRNYLLACGLDDALRYLETLNFGDDALDYLHSLDRFSDDFLAWLRDFRFTGDVYAVPEGTPVFADEPILEVVAPIAEAQLIETFVMNQVHFQTTVATKAARVVRAAGGRAVVDFGLRRMHGTDAGMKSVRAFHIAGVSSTSNVLAGQVYGVPVSGTMAHSYIQAFDGELDAFREFTALYPDTVLLVDTYDTVRGIERVIELARELGDDFRVRAVRIDSGDLAALSKRARAMLDEAGLEGVEVFLSGGLDEYEVAELIAAGTPVDGFGVGTKMGVSDDDPDFDIAYKLTAYEGKGRTKLSPGKPILPGRKQVFRVDEGDGAVRDIIARHDEAGPGRPLLRRVMAEGRRLTDARDSLDGARDRAREETARLPERLRAVEPAEPPYPVEVSDALRTYHEEVAERFGG